MWQDNIVEEIRRIRQAYAEQFNYDLEAIHRDLKEKQERSGRNIVSLPSKRVRPLTEAVTE